MNAKWIANAWHTRTNNGCVSGQHVRIVKSHGVENAYRMSKWMGGDRKWYRQMRENENAHKWHEMKFVTKTHSHTHTNTHREYKLVPIIPSEMMKCFDIGKASDVLCRAYEHITGDFLYAIITIIRSFLIKAKLFTHPRFTFEFHYKTVRACMTIH